MARKPRLHYVGALYHVMARGNGGQAIFADDEDRCRFYLLLQEGEELALTEVGRRVKRDVSTMSLAADKIRRRSNYQKRDQRAVLMPDRSIPNYKSLTPTFKK